MFLLPRDALRRTALGDGAWTDPLPGWLSGADALFEQLATDVPWKAERRQMCERVVGVPRLLALYRAGEPLPHRVLDEARQALSMHYAAELGEPFTTVGLCHYRDGVRAVGRREARPRSARSRPAAYRRPVVTGSHVPRVCEMAPGWGGSPDQACISRRAAAHRAQSPVTLVLADSS